MATGPRPRTRSEGGQRARKATVVPKRGAREDESEKSDTTSDSLPAMMPLAEDDGFNKKRTTSVTRPPRASRERRACIVALSGSDEGRIFKLDAGTPTVIGRGSECSLSLDDEGISRKHARIVHDGDKVVVEDLGSRNGTFVGERKITRFPLSTGDLIRVGAGTILKFAFMDDAEEEHHERLKAAALRDPLTGIYNRRHFDECLSAERAAALRHRKPLSLVVVDIDNFKKINDTHGHLAGDEVLRAVTGALQECARREDLVFRFGGEEFAILARDTDLDGSERFGERMRKKVAGLRVEAKGGVKITVTASFGVAQFTGRESEAALVGRADGAMYLAKRSGKDRVVATARG